MIVEIMEKFFSEKDNVTVREEQAIEPSWTGLTLFEKPLIGYAEAHDALFEAFKNTPEANLPEYSLPDEWLPGAKTVISLFFPFSDRIVDSNREGEQPSIPWVHGRWEGQASILKAADAIQNKLEKTGYKSLVPVKDPRFFAKSYGSGYTSNWSERHTAYACGLGTFGLSRGLITSKGTAGRFLSLITNWEHKPTERSYSNIYGYCNQCGVCIERCPPQAISFERGKNHPVCSRYLGDMKKIFKPRYGCGKCQTQVPCSRGIPA